MLSLKQLGKGKLSAKKLTAVLVVLALAGGGSWYYLREQRAQTPVDTGSTVITAQKKDVKISLANDGKADYPVTNLKFNGNGIVQEILVQEGQRVKKGDVLARLDVKNLENQVKQAEANYNSAVAKYQKLIAGPSDVERQAKQIAVDNAVKNLRVQQASYDYKVSLLNNEKTTVLNGGKTTEGDILGEELKLEGAIAQLENAKAQLALLVPADSYDLTTASETVKQMEAALAIARNNLQDATLISPTDGMILSNNGKTGELVTSSSTSTNTPFIVLANGNEVAVDSYPIEDDIGKISVGQAAEVVFTSLPDKTYEGKVSSISPNPVVDQSGIVTYKVSVILNAPDENIKNGMTASVAFIAQQVKGVVTIPVETVVRANGAPSVEVQSPDGSTGWVKVKTGLTDGKIVEIKDGLKAGDKILIRKNIKK
ncbi:efflux RND transporter periplasmic adaptor subunit [Desulfosporosinus metallidurans]|uniref:Putative RND efflux membrane fusion protein n=1 Tax=Desulfosporosinus metallidurans TaxID=1888891 RepID=A0A1Q8R050_9FIRM|nr:efflux RND transporter periplasmic adaptor subunit [Desulfosporosinus metallidurans]OLN33009.1 putative RND efflux membrane fusion protein [Desulfosporosinus metallidurans]